MLGVLGEKQILQEQIAEPDKRRDDHQDDSTANGSRFDSQKTIRLVPGLVGIGGAVKCTGKNT